MLIIKCILDKQGICQKYSLNVLLINKLPLFKDNLDAVTEKQWYNDGFLLFE